MRPEWIELCRLVIGLFLFSCAGWLMEVVLKYIQFHRFINRGYLIGPYCPIYGCGAMGVTVAVNVLTGGGGSYLEVFFVGLLVCGALEYFSSWFMEVMYHARWWDYSTKPMNLNGRVWIGNLLLFGAGSVLIVKWIDPLLFGMMERWPDRLTEAFGGAILLLFLTDSIISHMLMSLVKKEIDSSEADSTEEISRSIYALLKNRSVLLQRINEAYPNLQARPARLIRQVKEARRELREAAKNVRAEMSSFSSGLRHELEMSANARNHWLAEHREAAAEEKELRLRQARERLQAARERLHEAEERLFGRR